MAHLFYVTLGNKAFFDTAGNPGQIGWGLTNTGGFQNLLNTNASVYWAGLEPDPGQNPWNFSFYFGGQGTCCGKLVPLLAMAVRDGDVTAVPEPETYALMLAGLAGVALATRRRLRRA